MGHDKISRCIKYIEKNQKMKFRMLEKGILMNQKYVNQRTFQ